ncbi:MAG TPA: amino acid adenylation domain-containing protein [Ktedonobacteraceae bacterium]|jgi:amino acid adenylation domain-containing protein
MKDMLKRVEHLPPQKRELLLRLLKQQAQQTQTFPVSFAQQRMWTLDQLSPAVATYTISGGLHLQGQVRPQIIQRVLSEIVRRHATLRTIFPTLEGRPVQVIEPCAEFYPGHIDLSALPAGAQAETLQSLQQACALRPFELAQGPLLRTQLIRLNATEALLHIAVHHIVFDGWSLGVLMREFAQLYAAFAAGCASPLPTLPIQYTDFALAQWFQGQALAEQLAYWTRQLHAPPACLTLPTDHPRPPQQSFAGARYAFSLPAQLCREVASLSARQGVTLFMTLLSAFAILLGRAGGQSDLLIGTPIAGRTRVELEDLIGCFINTLVLRIDLSGNPRVRDLLARVQRRALEAYAHQDLPYEQLVAELRPARDPGRNPLFQAMFVLQNAPLAEVKLSDLSIEIVPAPAQVTPFDLSLFLWETDAGLQGFVEYASDLFEQASMVSLVARLHLLLRLMVQDLDLTVDELPLFTAAQQRQLLQAWNATASAGGEQVSLPALLSRQAARSPDAVALVAGAQHLSYECLDRQASFLAHHLRTLGVGPEVLVGVCLQRSLELVVALVAILKAGGAYLPLDPDYPVARQRFILRDAGVGLLLTQHDLAGHLQDQVPYLLCLDSKDRHLLSGRAPAGPVVQREPQALAYVIYTSGSTGTPKGVMIPQSALVNHMLWMQAAFPLTERDRVLQKTPCGFDAAIWEFYAPLLAGACLVLARPHGHQDSAYLVESVAREQISILQVVPALLRALLDEPAIHTCHSLERVFCGGEELGSELQRQALATLPPQTSLVNLYGPTECTIDACSWNCLHEQGRGRVPIGRPIACTSLAILDAAGAPLPIGIAGELCIAGAGVARGYLGRADLSAERFVPDPFTQCPGARLYRSGDLARYRPDGSVEYLGRIDSQVKVRGYRIEPGEIEAVLGQHPLVRACALVVRVSAQGERELSACVVARESAAAALWHELRAYLRQHLPAYMLPGHWLLLEALPLTPHGKVDRLALSALAAAHSPEPVALLAPGTPGEQQLLQIWAQVLKLRESEIGVQDNFFERGGHSLKGTQVLARVRQVCAVDLSLDVLFEHPTIQGLAQVIERMQHQAS